MDHVDVGWVVSNAATVGAADLNLVLERLNGNGTVSQSDLDLMLQRYWPSSPWLAIADVAGFGGSNVVFALTNSNAGAFTVESSSNPVDWIPQGPAIPCYEWLDTNSPGPLRHYRLRWP